MWPTLMMLWEEEGLTQVELASRCMTAHYTTTRVLDSLEKKQLVERRKHPTSRRSHLIYLTDEGRALKSALIAEAMDVNDSLLSVLQPQEQQQFLSLLAKMVAAGSAD
ncbi:MarR family transcriptional regulator [Ferrimonas sp. SCSIO 43195]|nr:MarR family transcriptional regulator [Ferrimonas sp. SCSIO 43195]